jgi:hypothetical protein
MSDPITPDPTPIQPTETSPDPEPEPSSSPDTAATDTFSREYVQDLRKEAAEWRTKYQSARQYEELFDGFESDDQRAAVQQLVELARTGDEDAVKQVAEVFGLEVPDSQPDFMTRSDFESEWESRMSKVEEDRAIEDVYSQAEGLGYKRDSEDMVRLLYRVNQMDEPDIKAAHEQLTGERQKIIDDYLESKRQDARDTPRPTPEGGSAPNTKTPPKTLEEARRAALARFAQ